MFFFGPKKDKNYFIAQKLFNILAEAAPEGLKEKIVLQKGMMKKAKGGHFFNTDYSLLFSYKMLYNGEPFLEIGAAFMDLPLASIRLKRGEQEFFADFFFNSKGVIFAVMFSKFPADDQQMRGEPHNRRNGQPERYGQHQERNRLRCGGLHQGRRHHRHCDGQDNGQGNGHQAHARIRHA